MKQSDGIFIEQHLPVPGAGTHHDSPFSDSPQPSATVAMASLMVVRPPMRSSPAMLSAREHTDSGAGSGAQTPARRAPAATAAPSPRPEARPGAGDLRGARRQRRQELSRQRAISASASRPHLRHMPGDVVVEQVLDDRIGHCTAERVAAVGAAVVTGFELRRHLLRHREGAQREAAGDSLSHRHKVRVRAGGLGREQGTGATEAGLNLVHDEQGAVVPA